MFLQQSQLEILKYEIRKFSVRYSKVTAEKKVKKQSELESKFKILEKSLSCDENIEDNHKCKADLNQIYDNLAERVKLRSKFLWYEESKKSSKYFVNLEKMQAERSTIRRLATYKKYLVKHNDINNNIFTYFTSLFERKYHIDKLNHNT